MTIPFIIENSRCGYDFISAEKYSPDNINEYIRSRSRFAELNRFLESFASVSDSDIEDITLRFAISAENKNDLKIVMLAIYYAIQKRGIHLGKLLVFNKAATTEGGVLAATFEEMSPKLAPLLEEDNPIIIDLDKVPDASGVDRGKLEFFIATESRAESFPVSSISNCINIPKETGLSERDILLEFFKDKGFDISNVTEKLENITSAMKGLGEYNTVGYGKKVINEHLLKNPYSRVLSDEDFDFMKVEKKYDETKEFKNLIGLSDEMKQIDAVVSELLLQRERVKRGLTDTLDGGHLVFAGAPGTAKTTLARMFARCLSFMNIIPRNNFRECVKSDFVGQYIGHTAAKIDKLFKDMGNSGGGVLFFDEIYTISEKDASSFDKEAVTSLVQNMENYRGKVFCVFAGYENKMLEFLSCNPGMRSRITNVIRFREYDDKTLCDIFKSIAAVDNYKLPENCDEVLTEHFKKLRATRGENFGNGREARNLYANTKQQHAVGVNPNTEYTDFLLNCLSAEDIKRASETILKGEIESSHTAAIGFIRN